MAPSRLAGAPTCNEQLPVGEPEETYLFHQFMPIVRESDGSKQQVVIPVELAHPNLLAWVKDRPRPGDVERMGLLKRHITPFVAAWADATVDTAAPPRDVYVPDVAKLLASGRFEDAGKSYDISALDEVKQQLGDGSPVVARFYAQDADGGELIRLIPGAASSCAVGERLRLDPTDVAGLVAGEPLLIAGVGAIKVELSQEDGERLVRTGFASVRARIGDQDRDLLLETSQLRAAARVIESAEYGQVQAYGASALKGWAGANAVADPDPADFPFVSPSFVVYVPITQRWKSLGYERGTLLNTFSLAPREEVTVEVFSWDRTRTGTESTFSSETQRSAEVAFSRKLTDTIVDTASRSWGWQFGANAGFQVPQINLNVGADFTIDERNQTTQQHTIETVNEGTVKVATMLKSSLQTKVTEAREFGTEERTTRRFQNPNLGRILHFDCFEVLHRYEVTTEYDFKGARLCVLIPFLDVLQGLSDPSTKARAAGLLALEGVLAAATPERLRSGFDAARQYLAWDRICQFSCGSACECTTPEESSPPPAAVVVTNPYETDLVAAFNRILDPVQELRAASGHLLESSLGPFPGGKAWKNCTADERAERQSDWHRFLFRRLVLERQLSGFWSDCVAFFNLPAATSLPDRIAAFERMKDRLIPSVADFLSPVFAAASIPMTMMDAFINGLGEFSTWVMGDMIKEAGFDDAGLQMAMIRAIEVYDKWRKVEEDKKPKPPPPDVEPEPEPEPPALRSEADEYSPEALAAASVTIDALVHYLLLNRSAYRVLIWDGLNPADRLRFLGLLGQVGKYVLPTVRGFVGDSIAVEANPEEQAEFKTWVDTRLVTWEAPTVAAAAVALPTPGMTMQTRLEPCDALEPYLTRSREIELLRLQALAAQQEAELARMKARLEKGLLDDPDPALPVLKVETATPAPPP